MIDKEEIKTCMGCNIAKPISDFGITKEKYVNNYCKSCVNAKAREYRLAKKNGTYTPEPRKSRPLPTHKICTTCNTDKEVSEFRKRKNKSATRGWGYVSVCIDCERNERNEYANNHKEQRKINRKRYYEKNKKKENEANRQYIQNNKEKVYENRKQRTSNDPCFKLRLRLSASINHALKKNDGSKRGKSILDILPYTIKQLKTHLENKFESWMTWDNHGQYLTDTWNDNDQSTWTWQIDHIIPHSTFEYTDMECQEFLDCWALSNLRPLSSKQNISDGASKIRHTTSSDQ